MFKFEFQQVTATYPAKNFKFSWPFLFSQDTRLSYASMYMTSEIRDPGILDPLNLISGSDLEITF